MRIENTPKARIELFDSFGEFIDYAKHNPEPKSSDKPATSSNWQGGTTSLSDAVHLASHGWNEVRPKVDKILSELQDRIAMTVGDRFVTEYSVTGADVDMGRFLSGEPECMMTFANEPVEGMGRVVKVAVAGTASSHIDPEDILRRGVAVLALVDTLHKLGVGIELYYDSSIEGRKGNKIYSTAVKLHDSRDLFDIDSIMFALAHPSMLRRLTFSVQEQSETAKQQGAESGGGYGYPASMALPSFMEFDVKIEKLQNGHGDIVKNPLEWVMSTVSGLGLIDA